MIHFRSAIPYNFPAAGYDIAGPVSEIYVHHFNSGIHPPQTVADSIARLVNADVYHAVKQDWGGIGYSWAVDDAGNIYECRGWWKTGAHTYGHNSKGYGIVWLGDSYVSRPTQAALSAIGTVIRMGINVGAVIPDPTIVAHRDRVPDTQCCGDIMYSQLPEIRLLTAGGQPQGEDDDDMPTHLTSHNGSWWGCFSGRYRPLSGPELAFFQSKNVPHVAHTGAEIATMQNEWGRFS